MPFDIQKAEKVRHFIENLVHSRGPWAGQPFELQPWQWERIIKPFYGTVDETGKRVYRFCYLEVPKKNGKTELAAPLALYHLCADGEGSPEVYSAAADTSQASLVYYPAGFMVRNNSTLNRVLKVRDSTRRIINHRNNGFYQVLSAEHHTKHGLSPSAVFFDELHAQPNDSLWRVLTAGTDFARDQQIIFIMTTAGIWNIHSIWWKIRTKAIQISKGIIIQPDFLPVLYLADPEKDKENDRELWRRVNPSLGRIFDMKKIERDYTQARLDPVDLQDFKRFRLNIPIKSAVRWMPMDAWDKCAGQIDIEALAGKICYGGLDMSTKIDLTAFVLVFPPQEGIEDYIVLPHIYCPEDTVMERSRTDKVHYEIWVEQGFMTATPGDTIDNDFIFDDVVAA
ncbi:MAG: terminase large subunit, partial [Deltaproteobacteria bacterium]|nr:terminase large subunit [Deltaproteobacteria bacterium]